MVPVSRMRGGVDADGAFTIGGYGTEFGGRLEITGRVDGTIGGDELSGVATYRLVGSSDEGSVHCNATYDVTGSR